MISQLYRVLACEDLCTVIATPPDPVLQWPLSLPLTQLWYSVYSGRYSWKNTLSCLACISQLGLCQHNNPWLPLLCNLHQLVWHSRGAHDIPCQHCQSVAAGVVCTCYLPLLLLCGGRLLFRVASERVADSVLACLALRAFLVVSMLMLQSESIISCCCCTTSTVLFSSAGDFWKNMGLLALIVIPGVSCCFAAFPLHLQSMLVCYLAYGCVCCCQGAPTCSWLYYLLCCMPASFLS